MIVKKELIIKNKGQENVPFFERLLSARDISRLDLEKNIFFDPYLMNDMEIAVFRIKQAVENKEKIMIYGDYDGGATRF